MDERVILKYLYDNYGDDHIDLLDILINKYPDPDREILQLIRKTFHYLNFNTHFITVTSEDYGSLGMNQTGGMITLLTLKGWVKDNPNIPHGISARITLDGIKEVESWQFQNQLAAVNDSVLKTNNSVRTINRLFWVTLIIAAISALFQALTYFTESDKGTLKLMLQDTVKLKQQIHTLQDSLKFIEQTTLFDTSLKSIEVQNDSSKINR